MGLLITLILAALVGWVASMIMKTDGQMGWVANVIVGIIGSILGTWLLGFIAPGTPTDNGLSIMGIVVGYTSITVPSSSAFISSELSAYSQLMANFP